MTARSTNPALHLEPFARPPPVNASLPLRPAASARATHIPETSPLSAASNRVARILIVDDDSSVLEILRIHLEDAGFSELLLMDDSTRVMDTLRAVNPDLLLTDLRIPAVTGFDLLTQVRADPRLAYLPVVMLTSESEATTRLKALDLGVTDFLAKPVDPAELVLRLRNNLAVKAYQDELAVARRESDRLLLSILPEPVADRPKRGEDVADHFDEATVLFADLVDFTRFASLFDPTAVVRELNHVFALFDRLVEERGLEKIKTIGDAYMLAGGVPTPRADHAVAVVETGLAMLATCDRLRRDGHGDFRMRVGVHTGPVLAGVIGTSKFAYDLWGDTVNVASRMESQGQPGCLQITDATRRAIGDHFVTESRGEVDIKGKRRMSARTGHRGRGAAALDSSGARAGRSGGVHSARRGDGAHRAHRRLGAARGLPSGGRVGRDGRGDLGVAVNVSPRQFHEVGFEALVCDVLDSTGLHPGRLVLEVTEGLLMNDPERAVDTLEALAGFGVKVSVDDFGTGDSSLAYLKLFKVDELKIDQSS